MEMLGNYQLTGELSSQNSGYSVWGYGVKDGREYFIKQFLSPKYPENDTVSSPERLQRKIEKCRQFEQQKKTLYHQLNINSDGTAVRVTEFFRIGSKYYISMPKIQPLSMNISNIKQLSDQRKRRLCAIIAHSVASFHRGGIVHADLKHDNVLFTRTSSGTVTAKIIDFDASFLESAPPAAGDEIVGDLVYFSPEACRSIWGESVSLTCKMDVFSMGVLFHQYFTGGLPAFDHRECSYPGEAVAKGLPLTMLDGIPADVAELIGRMLLPEAADRPTAEEVFQALFVPAEQNVPVAAVPVAAPRPFVPDVIQPTTQSGNPFFRPGDL